MTGYAEQREREKMARRARKKVEEAEAEIARIEAEIAEIEARIASGDTSDPEIFNLHQKRNHDLETAMSLWELAGQELEQFS